MKEGSVGTVGFGSTNAVWNHAISRRWCVCLTDDCQNSFQPNPNQKYCRDCAAIRRAAGLSRTAQKTFKKRREARLAKRLDGLICQRCQTRFVPGQTTGQKYCVECAVLVIRERDARRVRSPARIRLGSEIPCRNCYGVFTKKSAQHIYCEPCSALSLAGKLPHRRKAVSDYTIRRLASDHRLAINNRIRRAIHHSLNGKKQGRSWESLVGYSLDALVKHLARQFMPRMSWGNRHLWHIDHRVPLHHFRFDTAEDAAFRDAWALTNLQPLWKKRNLSKGKSRIYLV